MRITILGSASGQVVPHRNSSAFLIETKSELVLVDVGGSAAKQLVQQKIEAEQIDSVFISHTHADHASGIFMLLQWMNLAGRKNQLDIYLPEGVLPGFNDVFPYFHIFQEKWSFKFNLLPISENVIFKSDNLKVIGILNGHLSDNKKYGEKLNIGSDCYSLKFTEKGTGTLVYTSDIDRMDHLRKDKIGVTDLLISECTHVSIEDVLSFARNQEIHHVVFVHIPPGLDHYPSKLAEIPMPMVIQFARDGDVISLTEDRFNLLI